MSVIINDARTYLSKERLQARDASGRTQFQPLSRDWVSFLPEYFSYTSASRIAINGLLPSQFFQKGDRLRIEQTTDRYFYIINVVDSTSTTGFIDVAAGVDYEVANAAITEISTSRVQLPEGFPYIFQFDPTALSGTGSMTVTPFPVTDITYFYVNGLTCTLFGYIPDITLGGTTSYGIILDLPIPATGNYVGTNLLVAGQNNNTNEVLLADFGIVGKVQFTRLSGANWTLGTDIADIAPNVSYTI